MLSYGHLKLVKRVKVEKNDKGIFPGKYEVTPGENFDDFFLDDIEERKERICLHGHTFLGYIRKGKIKIIKWNEADKEEVIDSVTKFRVLDREVVGIPTGEYKVFSTDEAEVGFLVHPVESSDPKSLIHMLKYRLKNLIKQNFIEVLT